MQIINIACDNITINDIYNIKNLYDAFNMIIKIKKNIIILKKYIFGIDATITSMLKSLDANIILIKEDMINYLYSHEKDELNILKIKKMESEKIVKRYNLLINMVKTFYPILNDEFNDDEKELNKKIYNDFISEKIKKVKWIYKIRKDIIWFYIDNNWKTFQDLYITQEMVGDVLKSLYKCKINGLTLKQRNLYLLTNVNVNILKTYDGYFDLPMSVPNHQIQIKPKKRRLNPTPSIQ